MASAEAGDYFIVVLRWTVICLSEGIIAEQYILPGCVYGLTNLFE